MSLDAAFLTLYTTEKVMSTHHLYRENIASGQPHRGAQCVWTLTLTLSVGEVEEQTQGEQQRQQQQRGSGSVHGGTAWHQHALAASVALAHRAL